jgi:predicted nucleic acid-binding protein
MLYSRAEQILGEDTENGDVVIIASVLRTSDLKGRDIGVVSDDQRIRTVAQGFSATVTGTIGVIVRAVEVRDMTADEGKALVRRVDSHGLHMTGELREKAYELVEEAAEGE